MARRRTRRPQSTAVSSAAPTKLAKLWCECQPAVTLTTKIRISDCNPCLRMCVIQWARNGSNPRGISRCPSKPPVSGPGDCPSSARSVERRLRSRHNCVETDSLTWCCCRRPTSAQNSIAGAAAIGSSIIERSGSSDSRNTPERGFVAAGSDRVNSGASRWPIAIDRQITRAAHV